MSSKEYYGETHIFTSRNNNTEIRIKAGVGETLIIEGAGGSSAGGNTTEVQYNDSGSLAGDSTFFFDKVSKQLQVSEIIADRVLGFKSTDDMGNNQLSSQSILQHTDTTNLKRQGSSVSVSEGSTVYIASGGPNFVFDASIGGVALFVSTVSPTFAQVTTYLAQTTFTSTSYVGLFSDITEDSSRCIFSDVGDLQSGVMVYGRSGSTWTSNQTILNAGVSCKMTGTSGAYYSVIGDYENVVKVYFDSGSGLGLQQTLKTFSGSALDYISLSDIVNGNTIVYVFSNFVYVWTRVSTTWTNIQTIDLSAMSALVSISIYNLVMCVSSASETKIYTRPTNAVNQTFTLATTLSISNTNCSTTNDSYVFVATTTAVKVYSQSASWAKSLNDTPDTGTTVIGCSSLYLVLGKPGNDSGKGQAYKYLISTYVNDEVEVNEIVMNDTASSEDLTINTLQGSILLKTAGTSRVQIGSGSSVSSYLCINGSATQVVPTGGSGVCARIISDGYYTGAANAARIGMEMQSSRAYSAGVAPVFVSFVNSAGSQIGSLYQASGSTVALATSSDRRLKEDIEDFESGLDLINDLRPVSFRWKADKMLAGESANYDIGFIADEFQKVFPTAVLGNADGETFQKINVSVVIPALVSCIQELTERVKSLERKAI